MDLSRQSEGPQGDRFVCLWSPCKSTRTFGRVAELQRHYSEQHRSKVLDCMAISCPAKGRKGFTRSDKLSMHLRSHHSMNTLFLCPVSECDAGPLPPDLLWGHLTWHNKYNYPQIRSIAAMCFSCPVQGCTRDFWRGYHFLIHHDIDTRQHEASVILAAGFNPTSGEPICPICNIELEQAHFWSVANTKHLLSHDWESLYKYRREILRAWPRFGLEAKFQHVFEDILPTVDQRR